MISSVCQRKKLEATMVEPIVRPRKMVTTLAISLLAEFVRRSTTPASRMRLPNINMPISGVARGTKMPVASVTRMGKRIRAVFDTGFAAYSILMRRSSLVVNSRMTGG